MILSLLRRNPCLRDAQRMCFLENPCNVGQNCQRGCDGASNERSVPGPEVTEAFDSISNKHVNGIGMSVIWPGAAGPQNFDIFSRSGATARVHGLELLRSQYSLLIQSYQPWNAARLHLPDSFSGLIPSPLPRIICTSDANASTGSSDR